MKLKLSISTDYRRHLGDPEPYLKKISEAGFTHIHWCHEWSTDHLYSDMEIKKIYRWLNKYCLKMLDLHASAGKEANWISSEESKRKDGVNLIKNRIHMANKLSCNTIILHIEYKSDNKIHWHNLRKSLNELESFAREHGVRIALENLTNKNIHGIKKLLLEYDPDFLGLCYDSGHGNINNSLQTLEDMADRLISVHLHDNDGISDQHKLLFSGTLNWDRLAGILAKSSYTGCISMEVNIRNYSGIEEEEFLSKAYKTGAELTKLVQKKIIDS